MNEIMVNIFEQRELSEAINAANIFEPFLMTAFFGNKKYSKSDKIDKMTFKREQGISIAVNKNARTANLIEKGTAKHGAVTLPKFWDEKVFTLEELEDMLIPSTGYMNMGNREAQVAKAILDEIDDMKRRVLRTAEVHAGQALLTGKIVSGDFDWDFGFTTGAGKTIEDISGSATRNWTSGSAKDIVGDIEDKQQQVADGCGMAADTIIMGVDAWKLANADTAFLANLDRQNYKVGAIDRSLPPKSGATYRGHIYGCDLYVYNQKYAVKSGKTYTSTNIWDPTKVLVAASGAPGFEHRFSAIKRINKATRNVDIYSVEYLLTPTVDDSGKSLSWEIESCNLPCPWQSEALAVLKVKA